MSRLEQTFGKLLVALLGASIAVACADDTATGVDRDAERIDAGPDDVVDGGRIDTVQADDPDTASCQPACDQPHTACEADRCVCTDGYHEGGGEDGECVELGSCSEGYGIPEGGVDCLPVDEVCAEADACTFLSGWSDGACQYTDVDDGTPCEGDLSDPCAVGFECRTGLCEPVMTSCSDVRPVVFVHGVNGSTENFATMIDRLIADGWPEDFLFAFDAEDPAWGCNVDNAEAIRQLVDSVMATTCESRIDIVAHSMGTLSSRYYIKALGGTEVVNTYVTLGGMHHGLLTPCLAPEFLNVCVWTELCQSGEFIEYLNDDPATPGELYWVSIYGTADDTVPNDSSYLDGAENIEMEGVEHSGPNGLLEREDVYEEVLRVLQYSCW